MYKRMLDLKQLTDTKTYFLFGPRATGKTSLIQTTLPDVQIFDLLDDDTYESLARRPKA
jgi:predicted AAA+ superfamily ATPase